jgi:hypothetical protein
VPLGGVVINKEISKTFDEQVFPGGIHIWATHLPLLQL